MPAITQAGVFGFESNAQHFCRFFGAKPEKIAGNAEGMSGGLKLHPVNLPHLSRTGLVGAHGGLDNNSERRCLLLTFGPSRVSMKTRPVKGHEYGLDLGEEEKGALIAFLKTL
jgi:hypothetical protein